MSPTAILTMLCENSTQAAVAEKLGISVQYLNDILHDRREPGPKVLRALGIERAVSYRKARAN